MARGSIPLFLKRLRRREVRRLHLAGPRGVAPADVAAAILEGVVAFAVEVEGVAVGQRVGDRQLAVEVGDARAGGALNDAVAQVDGGRELVHESSDPVAETKIAVRVGATN